MKIVQKILSLSLLFVPFLCAMEETTLLIAKSQHVRLTTTDNETILIDPEIFCLCKSYVFGNEEYHFKDKSNMQLSNTDNPYINLAKRTVETIYEIAQKKRTANLENGEELIQLFCTAQYLQAKNVPFISWAEKIKSSPKYSADSIVATCVEGALCNVRQLKKENVVFDKGVLVIKNAPLNSLYNFKEHLSGREINPEDITKIQICNVPLSVVLPVEMQSILCLPNLKKIVLEETLISRIMSKTFTNSKSGTIIQLINNSNLIEIEKETFGKWESGSISIVNNAPLAFDAVQNIYSDLDIENNLNWKRNVIGCLGGFLMAMLLDAIVLGKNDNMLNDPWLYSLIPANICLWGGAWGIYRKVWAYCYMKENISLVSDKTRNFHKSDAIV
jgi:hypothetical protein